MLLVPPQQQSRDASSPSGEHPVSCPAGILSEMRLAEDGTRQLWPVATSDYSPRTEDLAIPAAGTEGVQLYSGALPIAPLQERVLVSYRTGYGNDIAVDDINALSQAQHQGSPSTNTPVYDLSSQAGIDQMVAAHNEWRSRYAVPPLKWSPELAAKAQSWAIHLAQSRELKHSPNTSKYGENLASATGQRLTPAGVVNMWGGEVNDYTYSSNRCAAGKMCGHYTQVVWRTTIQVGCGMARIGSSEVWVCNYNPPGNYVGQRPY